MILVGQYDSPFVRRTAVTLHHHGIGFERRALSVFGDFDAMLALNPLGKVPVLILDDGEALIDSRAILDHVDGLVAPARRLLPPAEPERRQVLRLEAVALGLAEKTYELGIERFRRAPDKRDPVWAARLERQICSALDWLEARVGAAWLQGARLTSADIAAAITITYLTHKQPALDAATRCPRLATHCARCEALPAFRAAAYSASEAAASASS